MCGRSPRRLPDRLRRWARSTTASSTSGSRRRSGAFLSVPRSAPQQFRARHARCPLVKAQFNTVTPENVLKWERRASRAESVRLRRHPTRYVAFGERNGMFIVGHTLVWHSQTPRWVFEDAQGQPLTRDTLLARMRDHISHRRRPVQGAHQGLGRRQRGAERGRHAAQVALAAIIGAGLHREGVPVRARGGSGGASCTTTTTPWRSRQAGRRRARSCRSSRRAGVRSRPSGSQGHHKLDVAVRRAAGLHIRRSRRPGVKVHDHGARHRRAAARRRATRPRTSRVRAGAAPNLDPYKAGLPDSVQQALAQRYADLFRVYLKHRDVDHAGHVLGRGRRRLVAERLAGAGAHELSVAVRSFEQTQARLSARDGARAGTGSPADAVIFVVGDRPIA